MASESWNAHGPTPPPPPAQNVGAESDVLEETQLPHPKTLAGQLKPILLRLNKVPHDTGAFVHLIDISDPVYVAFSIVDSCLFGEGILATRAPVIL